MDLRVEDGDGDSRKPSARAEVEQGGQTGWQGVGTRDGFEDVTAENFILIADGGEVGFFIPLEEEPKVVVEEFGLPLCQWWKVGLVQECGEFYRATHAETDSSMLRGSQQDAA